MLSCSTQSAQQKPLPTETVRTATMNITPGIEVLAHLALPNGFVPAAQYPPMWLQNGTEVAVAGTRDGHTTIMGYAGVGYRTERVIAEDGGLGASDGRIVDVAASPDGMVLALAVAKPTDKRFDVVAREVISQGAASPISSFDGEFDSAGLGWVDNFTILVALRSHPANPQSPRDDEAVQPAPEQAPVSSGGLYIINESGVVTTGYMKLNCKMSRLSWSPDGNAGAGFGDANAPAVLIDRAKGSCRMINAGAPIRVLDWAHDSKAFLFQDVRSPASGAYRYDLQSSTARLVAIASGAAAFVGNDQILALGDRGLTLASARNA
ncbi:MAG TPA: hypothetical protein VMT64_05835, partial [Candidatus Binataceae bacterium]|nr:hypothetical protein [Candidatus Binataceae bacterium]